MPIYVVEGDDHRQISTDDLAKMMSIDKKIIEKLKKNPVFEINPKLTKPDKLNGGVIAPAGKLSKPKIFVKVKKSTANPNGVITTDIDGLTVELRYAMAIVPDKLNHRISTYEPKRLVFYDQLDIVPNLEEALFKYILPACKDSPIADKRNWYYSFQNKEAAALAVNEKGQNMAKALAYISNAPDKGGLTDNQILLIAKGLYATNRNPAIIPNPSAHNKTIEEIKADLITLVLKSAEMTELFLNSCDDDVNEFYGMLLDAVDRGIFGIRRGSSANNRGWYWESGPNKGEFITDIGPGVVEFDALKAAVEANPNAFYMPITKAVTEASGKQNIKDFLKANKMQEPAAGAGTEEDDLTGTGGQAGENYITPPDNFVIPTEYREFCNFAKLFNGGKSPVGAVLGKFWQAFDKDKTVTPENYKEVLDKLIEENS